MPAKDPVKRRATVRAWYARTRAERAAPDRERRKARKRVIASWYSELKEQLACRRCGENHPACIQFHHIDPTKKEWSVIDGIWRGWGRKRILDEIARCETLCANCHAKHHAREGDV